MYVVIEDGEPAFPHNHHSGLTLRDYFAGQALAAYDAPADPETGRTIADRCYYMADAMIAARKRASDA